MSGLEKIECLQKGIGRDKKETEKRKKNELFDAVHCACILRSCVDGKLSISMVGALCEKM